MNTDEGDMVSPPPPPPPGGGSSQRHHLQLPREPHQQPDAGPGAELRLAPLHAVLSAGLHPAGVHPQPQVPGSSVSGGQSGDDGQFGPHLLLLAHGKHHAHHSIVRLRS